MICVFDCVFDCKTVNEVAVGKLRYGTMHVRSHHIDTSSTFMHVFLFAL